MVIWIKAIENHENKEDKLILEQRKTELFGTMLHAAHARAINLYRMATVHDPFKQDESAESFVPKEVEIPLNEKIRDRKQPRTL